MVIPRLPIKLREKLGDDAMIELATMFGDLGAETRSEFQGLRAEFRELRDSNARLEARMESGFMSLRHEIADVNTSLSQRIEAVNTNLGQRIEAVNADLSQRIEAVNADLSQRIADVNIDLRQRIADVNADLSQRIADVKPQISSVQAELIKWTFLFWIGTIGLVLLLLRYPT